MRAGGDRNGVLLGGECERPARERVDDECHGAGGRCGRSHLYRAEQWCIAHLRVDGWWKCLLLGRQHVRGAFGDSSTTNSSSPVPVSGGLTFTTLSSGDGYTCALSATSLAYCWGTNLEGELGDGTSANSATPTPVR